LLDDSKTTQLLDDSKTTQLSQSIGLISFSIIFLVSKIKFRLIAHRFDIIVLIQEKFQDVIKNHT